MILKKKEIIAASLVVLIGVAGYLNWSYQDTIKVRDGESYVETGKKLGEAQYVSSNEEVEESVPEGETAETIDGENNENTEEAPAEETSDGEIDADYFDRAKLNREESRSKSLEILNQTAQNESFDEEIRKKAGDKILTVADNVQKESEIEGIAQSKGYSEICVYVDSGDANVVVRKDGFNNDDVVKLTELVTDHLKISAQNVKIVEVK